MKNLFILSAFLLFPVLLKAQFKAGQIFFQGGASLNLSDTKFKSSGSDEKYGNYGHNISYSSGYFTADNRAIGWTLGQSLSLAKYNNYRNATHIPRTLRSISFSGGRFVEHYKSLSDKFALYIRPGFGLTYRLQNDDRFQESGVTYDNKQQTNTFTLGIDLGAGMAWRVSPKWALYGGFAFANPINISAGWTKGENLLNTSTGTRPIETKGSFFNYTFSPSLNSGSINLGFRYLATRANTY